MTLMAAEGRVLVASTTERDVTGGHRKDVGTSTPDSGVKGGAARKKRSASAQDDGQVANALRSVYTRAVAEDNPAAMPDLPRMPDCPSLYGSPGANQKRIANSPEGKDV